jgi:lipoprotein-releasing system ATP-binding protein
MSKVQSPKSENEEAVVLEAETSSAHTQRGGAGLGLWTLDIGLRVTDLRKSFTTPNGERVEVLRGASFSANAGEAIAIMGASGAGKSTLLQLLGGLEAADHGSIVAGEFVIDHARPFALAKFRNRQVGFVFQFHHLLPDLTAAENVSLPLLIARSSRREATHRATEMLAEVGLDRRASTSLVGHLSGGEQQRVAVCRALITNPSLVLADEPTGNLDISTGGEIAQSLVSYARNKRAVVVIATHNQALAELCDRTLSLCNGRLQPT